MSRFGMDSSQARMGAAAVLGVVVLIGGWTMKVLGVFSSHQEHREQTQQIRDANKEFRGVVPAQAHVNAAEEMARIAAALHEYADDNEYRFPDDLSAIGLHKLKDPFSKQPYWYVPSADRSGFTLTCMGSDQALGGTGPAADIKYNERGRE